ncbi:crotonase/enoyl-CoA hydratase family protein [Roseiarcaceae bacterium H3SJ34-1]|nr:crotonase/enoyl-CoA hydratase family protein [Roseiarcaceae bacterium H3SJ34-1]
MARQSGGFDSGHPTLVLTDVANESDAGRQSVVGPRHKDSRQDETGQAESRPFEQQRKEPRQAHPQLPIGLRFAAQNFNETQVEYDPQQKALWCRMKLQRSPSFTPQLLHDLHAVHHLVNEVNASEPNPQAQPVRFYVGGSVYPGIFNLGGDLPLFLGAIRQRDHVFLRQYAYSCVEAMYNNASGFTAPVISLVCLEGDALGGGLECALSFDVIIAERDVKLGLPEIMFGSFPGMGAFNFLTRRIGPKKAEQMMLSGKIYRAEECYEMGLVDILVNKGGAIEAAKTFIKENQRKHAARCAITKINKRMNPLSLQDLRDITDIWVDHTLSLDPIDLRRMEYLANAQTARLRANEANR